MNQHQPSCFTRRLVPAALFIVMFADAGIASAQQAAPPTLAPAASTPPAQPQMPAMVPGRQGKLLLTSGVSSIDGAAGGGLTPWAVTDRKSVV